MVSPSAARGATRELESVTATSDPAEAGVADLIVFGVKLWDSETAAAAMLPMIGPKTLVVTFQNGIDSADILARFLPREQIVRGAYYISAHIAAPGIVADTGAEARMVLDGRDGDARVLAFQAACAAATGLTCAIADPQLDFIWQKFVVLTAFSGSTALLRKPLGAVYGHPVTRAFLRDLVDESAAVAFARGAQLPANIADVVFERLTTWAPEAYASMAVDLMHGRRLELPWLSGRLHQLGLELGIPTPAHTAVYRGLVLYEMGEPG